MLKELYQELSELLTDEAGENQLILFNDEIHTFNFVIESLVIVCGHTYEQATQSALITHYIGKCSIKNGSQKLLSPLKNALRKRNLIVEIE